MHKVIDLFAGAGGLSLGFKKTGKYEIAAAFEINQNAQKTYKKNHPGTEVFSDVCSADFKKLRRKLGKIDVVIGGPPCQGFSMANRQKNHVISQNNMLVKQYVRAVMELEPNYTFNMGVLNALEFGAPQRRNRFVFIGIKKKIAKTIEMPIGTFTEDNYRTVKDAIKDIENVQTVFEASEDIGTELTDDYETTSLTPYLRDSKRLYNHIITQTRAVAKARFEALSQGENFHSLDAALKENTYTDVSRTQNTIYQRLNYEKPSGTVLNVRKSMWIHPTINRAVSVREAARLQTFPDSFVFCGTKDSQYQQVGNAVPPILAEAIAEHLALYLDKKKNG